MPDAAAPTIDDALRFLRAHRAGEFVFDEHVRPLRFVAEPSTGRLFAPVMVAMLQAGQHVLCLPRDEDDAMRVLITPEEAPGDSALADRWRIFHGEPEDVRWATLWIDFAKWRTMVFDGDAMMVPNALADAEPALCRLANADKAALRALCERAAGVDVEAPVCVGVDHAGVYVRGRFEVHRVEFAEPAEAPEDAERTLAAMLAGGSNP